MRIAHARGITLQNLFRTFSGDTDVNRYDFKTMMMRAGFNVSDLPDADFESLCASAPRLDPKCVRAFLDEHMRGAALYTQRPEDNFDDSLFRPISARSGVIRVCAKKGIGLSLPDSSSGMLENRRTFELDTRASLQECVYTTIAHLGGTHYVVRLWRLLERLNGASRPSPVPGSELVPTLYDPSSDKEFGMETLKGPHGNATRVFVVPLNDFNFRSNGGRQRLAALLQESAKRGAEIDASSTVRSIPDRLAYIVNAVRNRGSPLPTLNAGMPQVHQSRLPGSARDDVELRARNSMRTKTLRDARQEQLEMFRTVMKRRTSQRRGANVSRRRSVGAASSQVTWTTEAETDVKDTDIPENELNMAVDGIIQRTIGMIGLSSTNAKSKDINDAVYSKAVHIKGDQSTKARLWPSDLRKWMSVHDHDNSGTIDHIEFCDAMRKLGARLTSDEELALVTHFGTGNGTSC